MAYKRYTEEQIERANRISVVDYARSQGLEIERGSGTWRKAKHQGGLIFNTSKNTWKWETEDKYGRGAISLCMELENKTFQEAVETLIGEGMEEIRNLREWKKPEQPVAKDFNLPPRNDTNKHVYAYLTKTRGIDAGIVKNMLDAGYIYENDKKSCVFVGFDKEHTARHASIRSTNTQGKAFKQDVTGSQKQFSFSVDGTSGIVNVTEAPIDALSVMSLQKMRGTGKGDAYVALGGVSDRALERYLEDHPEITGIRICTDNDEAGEKAAERIREKYGEKYKIGRQVSQRKDFNEDLIAMHKDREFRKGLHDVVSGKRNISDSIVIGKTPNILVACGAREDLNFTISKKVIDKSMRPEIRDAEGRLTGKTGHGLTEQQLCDALISVKTPIMILKGNRDNSLIAVTEQTDNRNRPIFVTFTLDKMSGRTEINNVTSVYGRDKFQEYLERQAENKNILAVDNKKAEPLLQPIGKWYPKRGEVISYDATIAYTLKNVKYPETNSDKRQAAESEHEEKKTPVLNEQEEDGKDLTINEDVVSVSETEDRAKESGEDYDSELLDMWAQEYMDTHADPTDVIGYDNMVQQTDWEGERYREEQGEIISASDEAEMSPDASVSAEEDLGNVSRENYVAETSGNIISLRNDMMESFVGFINEYAIDNKIKEDALRAAVDPVVEGDVLRTYVDSVVNTIGAEDSEYLTDKLMDAVTVLKSKIDRLGRASGDITLTNANQKFAMRVQKYLQDYDKESKESISTIMENLESGNIDGYVERLGRYAENLASDAAEKMLDVIEMKENFLDSGDPETSWYASGAAEEEAAVNRIDEKYNAVMHTTLAIEIQKHLYDYDKNFSESAAVISENLTNGNIDEYLEQLDRYAEDLNSDAAEMSLYASVGAEEVADADKAIEKYNTVMNAMGRLQEFQKRVTPLQPAQKAYEDYLQMVSGNGNSLKNVPQEFYTEGLLLSAVSNWGAAMKYIPEEVMTNEIAMAGVKQYGTNLKHVPDKFRTQEVCVAAYVSSGGSSFKYTPAALKENVKKQALELLDRDSVNYPDAKHQLDADNLRSQGEEWMSRIETMLREHETDADAMAEDIVFAGKFYKYSTRNIQLMLQQNRGITYVGSASHFKQLGYQVKQDEKAMIARVPIQSRYIVNDDNKRVYSSDYTQEIKDAIKNGTLKENVTSKRFKYVSAFYDISQTDCPPEDYPSIYHMGFPSEMHQNLFDAMKEFAVSQGFRVQVVDMKSIALRGAANPDEKIIRINDKLEPTMALSTLCHEIGHGLLHTSGQADKMTQAQKECEADVVSIMIMANLGLPISDSRKEHLLKAFTEYKEQQASKERPYEVTLEKLIDRVQTKVFRPYVEEMNRCISRHLPSEGIQNEMQAEAVIGSIANLDAAHGTDHTDLISTEKEIFENDRADIYREAYHKAFEETRLYNSFEPKLAILRQQGPVMENGMQETYLCEVKLINKELAEIFSKTPEMIDQEYLGMDIHKGDILVFRENLMAAPAVYQVGADKLVPVTEESLPGLLNAITSDSMLNKINSGFDIRHEYECLHSLMQRDVPLEQEMIDLYEKLCDTFAFEKLQTRDNSLQFQARLNLITDELSEPDKELVTEYVFRTGNFKKAEKYAEKLAANPETSGQILTEMGIVDSYKYMLWTIAEYENNMDLPESQRITTGAYNSASIPVLSSNVKSLSQINNSFISIRQCAVPDRVKYYAIKEAEGEFKIAYVALDGYRPELRYSVPFNSYEAALDFYNSFISDTNSNLAGENENLIELERKNNEIILSEVTAIAATLIDGKEELKESYPELSEEELLDALRRELAVKHRDVSDKIPDNVRKELELLKEFKQGITDKEHFVEICNLQKLSVNKEENSDFNYQEALNEFSDTLQWVVDIGDEVGRLSFPQVNEVWDCIEAALDGEVTVSHINNAFNAIDARILSVEFEGMESEYAEYADYAGVFETLKEAYVMPDKYCYVDFSDQDEPHLYTSDPAGNMYKKSVRNYGTLESVGNLYNELQVRGYQVCTDFNEFKALSANKRIASPDAEKDKNGAYVKILSHTEGWDIASAHELCSVFEFKQQMDKQQAGTGGNPGSITYELVVKSDKEVQSYIENYSGNTGRNVYEQLYDKVKEENPELNRVIAKQYYQDQIDFNEKHYIKPVISQIKKQEIRLLKEKQPVSDYTAYKDERGDIHVDYGNTEMNSGKLDGMEVFLKGKTAAGEELMQLSQNLQTLSDSMDANEKLQEEIQKLDLSPADADILKLNGGMITPEQLRMQVNQQKQQQQIKKSEIKMEME